MLQVLDEAAIKKLKRYGFERAGFVSKGSISIPTSSELALMLVKGLADAMRKDKRLKLKKAKKSTEVTSKQP